MAEEVPSLQRTDTQVLDSTFVEEEWGKLVSGSGKVIEWMGEEVVLGRGTGCTKLDSWTDKRMSSRHCRLFCKDGTVWIEDLSTNGTWLNSCRIGKGKKQALKHGDRIDLIFNSARDSDFTLVFNAPSADGQAPASSAAGNSHAAGATQELEEEPGIGLKRLREKTPEKEGAENAETAKKVKRDRPESPAAEKSSLEKRDDSGSAQTNEEDKKEAKKEENPAATAARVSDEKMEENLICGICQEILYKAVCLIPCLHNFCAACYCDWGKRNGKCPVCRDKVRAIRPNHAINSVVESYLEIHPDKKRPAEEMKAMDAKNKLTDMVMKKPRLLREGSDEEDNEEYDDEDDEEGGTSVDSGDEGLFVPRFPLFSFGFGVPFAPIRITCRQCRAPGPDGFMCPPDGRHLTCCMCCQPFPERAAAPPCKCDLCGRVFCDLYWGCPFVTGKGALKQMKDHNLHDGAPVPTISVPALLNNAEEAAIFRNYLVAKRKTLDDVYHELLDAIEGGKTSYNKSLTGVEAKPTTYSCKNCATRFLHDMLYWYRANLVPRDQLPPEVTSRPDCHWGRNCRTMVHNPGHAKRYNHICEQTRFA